MFNVSSCDSLKKVRVRSKFLDNMDLIGMAIQEQMMIANSMFTVVLNVYGSLDADTRVVDEV